MSACFRSSWNASDAHGRDQRGRGLPVWAIGRPGAPARPHALAPAGLGLPATSGRVTPGRPSFDGHQFLRPQMITTAGTISVRTRKVSISTPSAIAVLSCLIWLVAPVMAAVPKVAARISPADVTVVPV